MLTRPPSCTVLFVLPAAVRYSTVPCLPQYEALDSPASFPKGPSPGPRHLPVPRLSTRPIAWNYDVRTAPYPRSITPPLHNTKASVPLHRPSGCRDWGLPPRIVKGPLLDPLPPGRPGVVKHRAAHPGGLTRSHRMHDLHDLVEHQSGQVVQIIGSRSVLPEQANLHGPHVLGHAELLRLDATFVLRHDPL